LTEKAKSKTDMRHSILVMFFFMVCSCKQDFSPDVRRTLRLAGENRQELEKVLEHYSQNKVDSLKLRAAHFLIRNMPGHYSVISRQLDEFDSAFFDSLSLIEEIDYKYNDYEIIEKIKQVPVEKIWQNMIDRYGDPSTFHTSKSFDHQTISAKLLIENIDYAFEAWRLPWSHHLTFDQFCEYVLPYRFADEPLESWRPYFMEQYKWLLDSLKDKSDPVEACTLINKDIASWFLPRGGVIYKRHPRGFSPSQLVRCKISFCIQQAAVASFAMRAIGLAVAHNPIPHWGNRSMGHDFSSVLSREGKFVDFLGADLPPGKNEIKNKVPKIYRETFSFKTISSEDKKNESLLYFDRSRYIDVTSHFIPTSQVILNLSKKIPSNIKVIYLCIFDNKNWIPVEYSRLKGDKVQFNAMGVDIVYLPVYYFNGNQVPAEGPFLLSIDGATRDFLPNSQITQNIKLYRKYPLARRFIEYDNHMIGGKFQGANNPDFSDAIDLYIITSTPVTYFKSYPVNREKFRYLRYLFPPVSLDSAKGNVAELGFKGLDEHGHEIKLTGKYIGSPEITEENLKILFDNDLDNYITINIADNNIKDLPDEMIIIPYKKELWVGLDLMKPREITQISFCPRNDTNNIYEDCVYELFYWDDKWISLGRNPPKNDCLTYTNVSGNSLLLLHNHSGGKEERIFTYENGQQVWW
jgi:hypothetical protein